jgi:hypothetical protein
MATATVNLTQLATETSTALESVWNEIGVSFDERQTFLTSLSERVASLYTSAVKEQQLRREDIQSEIQTLQETIVNMKYAMEQEEGVVCAVGRRVCVCGQSMTSVVCSRNKALVQCCNSGTAWKKFELDFKM